MTDTQSPHNAAAEAALARLVETGDLDRLVAIARTLGGAADAMSDDIVGRVAGIAADGLDLLDRVNRSGVARALPALSGLIENGDLDRIVALARTVGGASDALSDDIVARLADLAGEGLALADRATLDGLAMRLLSLADHVEGSGIPRALIGALAQARKDVAAAPPVKGGVGGLISLMSRKDSQEAMQFGLAVLNALKRAI